MTAGGDAGGGGGGGDGGCGTRRSFTQLHFEKALDQAGGCVTRIRNCKEATKLTEWIIESINWKDKKKKKYRMTE